MSNLPWYERVPMLSVNPDSATRDDVARLAADLMEARRRIGLLIPAGNVLADAADAYAADQSGATDPRVGLVQPVTVEMAERLNVALKAWYEVVKE